MSEDKSPLEKDEADESTDSASTNDCAPAKSNLPPAVALAFIIIALLGVLIVMVLKSGALGTSSSSHDNRLASLQSDLDARRAELNRQRAAMGLSPLEGGSEPIEDIAGRLKKDADSLVALAARFQQMLAEKDTALTAKNAELIGSEKTRIALTSENTRLQTELNRALASGSDVELLRRDLASLRTQRDALSEELAAAKLKMQNSSGAVSADDFADLKRRYDETLRAKEFFEARVKELEGDLSKAKLFASSENELLPAAVELFRQLRVLEGKSDSDISAAYSSFGVDLGANVLSKFTFATGSSALTPADEEIVRNVLSEIPDGDLLFVVGYASETGNVDGNRALSSDRATAVAQYYSSIKRPTQLVQAVYLGQTDRFSSKIPERNQLVEIWRIRKK
ncbi:OmpA family protein [Luteolibacter yonseiensis]|uniref:OmpA family protein n=1 Tax=Luteolibacter yonseiensis TaxID=1144680 RepID=A0A934VD70_9BACT|nr:OmpA family protein [Luteolibacter yonseiensis]MBK1817835.1 OmpA family protein [Luteolibacter yonseiensis]